MKIYNKGKCEITSSEGIFKPGKTLSVSDALGKKFVASYRNLVDAERMGDDVPGGKVTNEQIEKKAKDLEKKERELAEREKAIAEKEAEGETNPKEPPGPAGTPPPPVTPDTPKDCDQKPRDSTEEKKPGRGRPKK